MTNEVERVERRKHRRFEVPTGVFVSFRPHDGKLGEIIDISMGGLAFRYLATSEPSNGSYRLKIFLTESDFCLNDVMFETVSDFGTDQIPFTSVTMRRSGVQFSNMTSRQVSQLERFIDSHAEGEE